MADDGEALDSADARVESMVDGASASQDGAAVSGDEGFDRHTTLVGRGSSRVVPATAEPGMTSTNGVAGSGSMAATTSAVAMEIYSQSQDGVAPLAKNDGNSGGEMKAAADPPAPGRVSFGALPAAVLGDATERERRRSSTTYLTNTAVAGFATVQTDRELKRKRAKDRWAMVRLSGLGTQSRKGDTVVSLMPRLCWAILVWCILILIGGWVFSEFEADTEILRNKQFAQWAWLVERVKSWDNSTIEVDTMLDNLMELANPDAAARARAVEAQGAQLAQEEAEGTRAEHPWEDRRRNNLDLLFFEPEQEALDCSPGWLPWNGQCIHVGVRPTSARDARVYCTSEANNYSSSAAITSQSEYEFVSTIAPPGGRVWLGGSAALTWAWESASTGAATWAASEAWAAGQPPEPNGDGVCAYLDGDLGDLFDAHCDDGTAHYAVCEVAAAELAGGVCPAGAEWTELASSGQCVYANSASAPVSRADAIAACGTLALTPANGGDPSPAVSLAYVLGATHGNAVGAIVVAAFGAGSTAWTAAKATVTYPSAWGDGTPIEYERANATLNAAAQAANGPCLVAEGRQWGQSSLLPPDGHGWYSSSCQDDGLTHPLCRLSVPTIFSTDFFQPKEWPADERMLCLEGESLPVDTQVALSVITALEGEVVLVNLAVGQTQWMSSRHVCTPIRHVRSGFSFPQALLGGIVYATAYSKADDTPIMVEAAPVAVVVPPKRDPNGLSDLEGDEEPAPNGEPPVNGNGGGPAVGNPPDGDPSGGPSEGGSPPDGGGGGGGPPDGGGGGGGGGPPGGGAPPSRRRMQEVIGNSDPDNIGLSDEQAIFEMFFVTSVDDLPAPLGAPLPGSVVCSPLGYRIDGCLADPATFDSADQFLADDRFDIAEFRTWFMVFHGDEGEEDGLNPGTSGLFISGQQQLGASLTDEMSRVGGDHLPLQWDFNHACFIAMTVLTTIGYGSPAPSDSRSQIFVVFYALMGIGATGFMLDLVSRVVLAGAGALWMRVSGRTKVSLRAEAGIAVVLVTFLIVGGAVAFRALQANEAVVWTFNEATYFCFVTLSTVGFGDYTPTSDAAQILCVGYVVLGLGVLSMFFSVISEKLERLEDEADQQRQALQRKTTAHAKAMAAAATEASMSLAKQGIEVGRVTAKGAANVAKQGIEVTAKGAASVARGGAHLVSSSVRNVSAAPVSRQASAAASVAKSPNAPMLLAEESDEGDAP